MPPLGESIRTFRTRHGLSAQDFAELLAREARLRRPVPINTIYRWESGRYPVHEYLYGIVEHIVRGVT